MSIKIVRICILLLLVITTFKTHSQRTDTLYLYLNLDSELVWHSISKDTMNSSFMVYRKGYESKKIRDSIFALYYPPGRGKKRKIPEKFQKPKIIVTGEMPQMSFDFTSLKKPEITTSLNEINYITEKELRDKNTSFNIGFVIHKIKDNQYLIWKVFTIPEE